MHRFLERCGGFTGSGIGGGGAAAAAPAAARPAAAAAAPAPPPADAIHLALGPLRDDTRCSICWRTITRAKAGAYTRLVMAELKRILWERRRIQGLLRGCSGAVRGCWGRILCQKRLRLSWKVDECKPLRQGHRLHAPLLRRMYRRAPAQR